MSSGAITCSEIWEELLVFLPLDFIGVVYQQVLWILGAQVVLAIDEGEVGVLATAALEAIPSLSSHSVLAAVVDDLLLLSVWIASPNEHIAIVHVEIVQPVCRHQDILHLWEYSPRCRPVLDLLNLACEWGPSLPTVGDVEILLLEAVGDVASSLVVQRRELYPLILLNVVLFALSLVDVVLIASCDYQSVRIDQNHAVASFCCQ